MWNVVGGPLVWHQFLLWLCSVHMGDTTTGQPTLAMPSRLVYKKNVNLDAKMASLDQERRILQITPEKPNLLDSSSAIDSTINLSTPIATSLRNRSGNEFTLVLKYRISAESAEQKEAWFRQLGALGVHVRSLLVSFRRLLNMDVLAY